MSQTRWQVTSLQQNMHKIVNTANGRVSIYSVCSKHAATKTSVQAEISAAEQKEQKG